MGRPEWHPGPVTVQECLRETLLSHVHWMIHWMACPSCDPDQEAELLLMCVGWTTEEYLAEAMRRG